MSSSRCGSSPLRFEPTFKLVRIVEPAMITPDLGDEDSKQECVEHARHQKGGHESIRLHDVRLDQLLLRSRKMIVIRELDRHRDKRREGKQGRERSTEWWLVDGTMKGNDLSKGGSEGRQTGGSNSRRPRTGQRSRSLGISLGLIVVLEQTW